MLGPLGIGKRGILSGHGQRGKTVNALRDKF